MKCQNCKEELKRNVSFETYKCTNDECRMGELGYLEPSYFGPQWISICHDEPDNETQVLCRLTDYGQGSQMMVLAKDGDNWFDPTLDFDDDFDVTHWMPLP